MNFLPGQNLGFGSFSVYKFELKTLRFPDGRELKLPPTIPKLTEVLVSKGSFALLWNKKIDLSV